MLIVPDTHVLISGAALRPSYTGQIIRAWREKRLGVVTSELILIELRRVLNYPEVIAIHGWSDPERTAFVADVRAGAVMVSGATAVNICADPKDNKFFACALEARAAYIVSKDRHLLDVGVYQGIQTVKPGYFVNQVLKAGQII